MMLKSLKKLMDSKVIDSDNQTLDGNELVDEIQAEIDKFYFPKPLYVDDEPVDIDCQCMYNSRHSFIVSQIVYDRYGVLVADEKQTHGVYVHGDTDERLRREDSQEQINYDAKTIFDESMDGFDYVDKIMELLARQRKLDGVDDDA